MNRSSQQLRELLRQFVETDIGGKKLRGFAYERLRIEQNNESKPRDVLSGLMAILGASCSLVYDDSLTGSGIFPSRRTS